MLNSLTAIFISVLTFFASLFGCFGYSKAPEDSSDFVPVLRFAAGSDTHVKAAGDTGCRRIEKAINAAYSVADADKNYNKLDAVMFVGDLTNDGTRVQYCSFKSAVDSVLRDETQLMAVIAKSHDSTTMGKNAHSYYTALTGFDTDYHYVINGFHFIGLSTSKTVGEHYSEYQRKWLVEQLNAAAADDPEKPVFVSQHEHISNTVYGSSKVDGWGMDYFADILKQYPQVVDFSGHSHYPINDPRSIWQGEFTAVGTGELSYVEFTVDGKNKLHPDNYRTPAVEWIVEVDANNRIRLRGFDVCAESWLCKYIIENPSDPGSFEYTPEKMAAKSEKPQFSDSAFIEESGILGKYSLSFPTADSTDGMPVFLYRAYVYDSNGNEVQMKWELSGYYLTPSPNKIKIKLDKLSKGDYTVKVIAETAYGIQSEPLIKNIKV